MENIKTEENDIPSNDPQDPKDNADDLESLQILDSFQAGADEEQEGNEEQQEGDIEPMEEGGDEENKGDISYDPTEPTEGAPQEDSTLNSSEVADTSVAVENGGDKAEKSEVVRDLIKKMSGAARKRYRYFLGTGHDKLEARQLALNKTVKITDWAKFEEFQKQVKKESEKKPVNETVRVGILPENYPLVSLSKEDMEAIQGSILNKVLEKGGDTKPKFLGTNYKSGWFILKCANKPTADWIKEISTELQSPGGQLLRVVDNAEVPKTIMVYAYFPKSAEDTDEKVLQLIAAQNDKLNVSQWKVTQREIEGPALKLSIAIDSGSDEVLQGLQYRVAYKFGFVNLRTEDKEKERRALKKAAGGGAPSGSSGGGGPSQAKRKRNSRPSPRALSPPPRRAPSPPRRRDRGGPERRRGGNRFDDRRAARGGGNRPSRFPRGGERERRGGGRDDRFGSRRGRDDIQDSRPGSYGYGADVHPPLPKMPPPHSGPWGSSAAAMFAAQSSMGDVKPNDEMSMYFNQLKSLEEYNKNSGNNQSSGNWYTQPPAGSYGGGNQRH